MHWVVLTVSNPGYLNNRLETNPAMMNCREEECSLELNENISKFSHCLIWQVFILKTIWKYFFWLILENRIVISAILVHEFSPSVYNEAIWAETYEHPAQVGSSEQSEERIINVLSCSKNNSHSNTEEAAHYLQRLTKEERFCEHLSKYYSKYYKINLFC